MPDQQQPTAEEILRHHPEGAVEYVDAHETTYDLRVVEHDPTWAAQYAALEATLVEALGPALVAVQHVGSTSVPGLPAKPILDVDLTVADPTDEAAYAPALQALGHVFWLREPEWHEHRLFKGLGDPRLHLHVFGPGCPEPVRHRMFRDWLRTHPDDRAAYAAAKHGVVAELAGSDGGTLGAGMDYNRRKEPVVLAIYERMFRAAGFLD